MKKKLSIFGTSVLTLALLSACTGEDAKDKEPEKTKDTETEVVEPVEEQATTPVYTLDNVVITGLEDLSAEQKQAVEKAAEGLKANFKAINAESMEDYLATIKTEDEELARTLKQEEFDKYDIQYKFASNIDVVSVSEDLSKIELRITQDAFSAEPTTGFQNQRLTAVHVLELVEDSYKLTSTEIDPESIFLLDDEGQPTKNVTTDTEGTGEETAPTDGTVTEPTEVAPTEEDASETPSEGVTGSTDTTTEEKDASK